MQAIPTDPEAAVFYALSQVAVGTLDKDPEFAREKSAASDPRCGSQGSSRTILASLII